MKAKLRRIILHKVQGETILTSFDGHFAAYLQYPSSGLAVPNIYFIELVFQIKSNPWDVLYAEVGDDCLFIVQYPCIVLDFKQTTLLRLICLNLSDSTLNRFDKLV